MLTKKDKKTILEALQGVDVKKLEIDHPDEKAVKWFRFGSFIGIDIATQIINQLPEKEATKKAKPVDSK